MQCAMRERARVEAAIAACSVRETAIFGEDEDSPQEPLETQIQQHKIGDKNVSLGGFESEYLDIQCCESIYYDVK